MSHLLILSPELLKQIFSASDTVQDALSLAATSQYLRAVWLEHSDLIIEDILKPSIPAYAEAVSLAITETRLSLSLEVGPHLRRCLGPLLLNADLCASACTAYAGARDDDPLPQLPYYLMRRFGLGLNHPSFREDLYSELRSATREKLLLLASLSHWVVAWGCDHVSCCGLISGDGDHSGILHVSAVGVNTEGQSSHELPCLHVSISPTEASSVDQILTAVRHVLVSTVCLYCARLALTKAVNHRVIERMLFDLYTSHVVLGVVCGHIVYSGASTSSQRCGDVCGVVDNKSRCR